MAASLRLSRTAKDRFVHDVCKAFPNRVKELEQQIEDTYWTIIIEKSASDPGLVARYTQLFDRLKAIRVEAPSRTFRRDTYGYYIFHCAENNQEFSLYSLAAHYSRVYINITVNDCNTIQGINNALSKERERMSSFREFMYRKMEICNNTKQVLEIFPQFAEYLPT